MGESETTEQTKKASQKPGAPGLQPEARGCLSDTGGASGSHPITQESSFNPPPLSQTHTQAYRHKGRYVCGYRITQPMKNSLMTETYRDEDGLIKQLRGRVKYVEEKSLLVQNGMGNQCL